MTRTITSRRLGVSRAPSATVFGDVCLVVYLVVYLLVNARRLAASTPPRRYEPS
jgi:hypothetical protein